MSKNKGPAWNTKYGIRRVRNEEPTIEEALEAARDISDDRDAQVEIASSLMGLPQEQIRAALRDAAPAPKQVTKSITFAGPATKPRVVVVETKRPRRVAAVQR
ncbi:hypothetical protein [Pseudorhodoplanes sp.]|uniref:hypothetical protein n=1 Tax=Pseudorhodoplanes sp. TaxID=1934341 RepID=UPI002BEDA8D2|nr:hypothetical protein [Pseudorhodoplanes sp.]HWV55225.1 hypothetical protein [Pseudorhodoplanes sp.]